MARKTPVSKEKKTTHSKRVEAGLSELRKQGVLKRGAKLGTRAAQRLVKEFESVIAGKQKFVPVSNAKQRNAIGSIAKKNKNSKLTKKGVLIAPDEEVRGSSIHRVGQGTFTAVPLKHEDAWNEKKFVDKIRKIFKELPKDERIGFNIGGISSTSGDTYLNSYLLFNSAQEFLTYIGRYKETYIRTLIVFKLEEVFQDDYYDGVVRRQAENAQRRAARATAARNSRRGRP